MIVPAPTASSRVFFTGLDPGESSCCPVSWMLLASTTGNFWPTWKKRFAASAKNSSVGVRDDPPLHPEAAFDQLRNSISGPRHIWSCCTTVFACNHPVLTEVPAMCRSASPAFRSTCSFWACLNPRFWVLRAQLSLVRARRHNRTRRIGLYSRWLFGHISLLPIAFPRIPRRPHYPQIHALLPQEWTRAASFTGILFGFGCRITGAHPCNGRRDSAAPCRVAGRAQFTVARPVGGGRPA